MLLHYFKQENGNNLDREPSGSKRRAHANEHALPLRKIKRWTGADGATKRAEDKEGKNRNGKDEGCAVTACDNSREIVSFIVGVITIIVILRVPTAIS